MRFRMRLQVAVAVAVLAAVEGSAQGWFGEWRLSRVRVNIPNGGRANTIAVDPRNDDVVLVASQGGGLFRTTDRGATWRHVDGLPVYETAAVAFHPRRGGVVLATSGKDFKAANGGGIWRSTDGGATWRQVGPPLSAAEAASFWAREITIAPDDGAVYVATSQGVAKSVDGGASWTLAEIFGGGEPWVSSVVALRRGVVIAGGAQGLRRSIDGGTSWIATAAGIGSTHWRDLHALARSPYGDDQAYVLTADTAVFHTTDGGARWTRIDGAPPTNAVCGGLGFVRAAPRTRFFLWPPRRERVIDLYAGNRCGIARLTASRSAATQPWRYDGSWTSLSVDHADTRDVAFDGGGNPFLLATDGGLHEPHDGGARWTLAGGAAAGFDALQMTEVKGQWITSMNQFDLYFGTQDNNLYSSADGGRTWAFGASAEGFFIERERVVRTPAESTITFTACGDCANYMSGRLFAGVTGWRNPLGVHRGNPKSIGDGRSIQFVIDGDGFRQGFAVTPNRGLTWHQYAATSESLIDLPKQSSRGGAVVLYQPYRFWHRDSGRERDHLLRLEDDGRRTSARVVYPAMNGFGSLGQNPTEFAWYEVFGVDPHDARHLIAPDVVNGAVMESRDGGQNWTPLRELTDLVTDGGRFRFDRDGLPFVSAVSFAPHSGVIAVGTWENGIFVTQGAGWQKVPGSERITQITSIEWKDAGHALVSTYGRGLWRVQFEMSRPFRELDERRCGPPALPPCHWHVPPDPRIRPALGVLVYGGRIEGIRSRRNVVQELFVTPGSSAVFFSDSGKSPKIAVTPTRRVPRRYAVAEAQLVGLSFDAAGKIAKRLPFAGPLPLAPPDAAGPLPGALESPLAGKPRLQLVAGAMRTFGAGESIEIAGRAFPAGATLAVALNGVTVANVQAAPDGRVALRVDAPRELGTHRVTIAEAATGVVLDGFVLRVTPRDQPRQPRQSRQLQTSQ